jgi:hypothetical protein
MVDEQSGCMNSNLFVTLPVAVMFAFVFGIMIFLGTYIHFPKMERKKRIEISLINAVSLALILLLLVYISLFFILGE